MTPNDPLNYPTSMPTGDGLAGTGAATVEPPPVVTESASMIAGAMPADVGTLGRHGTLASPNEEMKWYTPALPSPVIDPAVIRAQLDSAEKILGDHPGWREMLHWTYESRVLPASLELQEAERQIAAQTEERATEGRQSADELERRIKELEERREQLDRDTEFHTAGYAEAMGQAGLMASANDLIAGPHHIREALQEVAPTVEELAGEHGIVPNDDEKRGLGTVLMEAVAPMVCGFMLAISLGTLTGLLDLADIQTLRRPPMIVIAFLLGSVIVALIGNLVKSTVAGYVHRGEERYPDAAPVPRLKSGVFLGLMAFACVVFVAAEVAAEALGLRDLNRQKLIEDARLSSIQAAQSINIDDRLLPIGFFLVIGTLISGPYIAYKASRGWKEAEDRQRRAWLAHRRLERIKQLSREEPVMKALGHARRVEVLNERVTEIDAQLTPLRKRLEEVLDPGPTEAMKKRLDYATQAAVGESMRLHEMLEEMIADVDPLPRDQVDSRRR